MTLTSMAASAVNTLSRIRSQSETEYVKHTARQARIARRWEIVYVQNRGAWFPEHETVVVCGRRLHADDTISCERCDELCTETTPVHARGRTGRMTIVEYCDECREDRNVEYCANCCDFFDSPNMVERDGDSYCENCAEELEPEEDSSSIPSYHNAHRWDAPMGPSYSFELEVEAEERDSLVAILKEKNFDRVSWEMDGSLSCEKGLEILIQHRSSPGALAQSTIQIVQAIKGKGLGLHSWEGGKCGMHLNSNRSGWSKHSVMRLIYIVQACKEQLVKISGRESNQWANFGLAGYTLRQTADSMAGKYRALRVGWDRFEWRMFRGTLCEKRIRLYCATVHALEALAQSDIQAHHLRDEAVSTLRTLCSNLNFSL